MACIVTKLARAHITLAAVLLVGHFPFQAAVSKMGTSASSTFEHVVGAAVSCWSGTLASRGTEEEFDLPCPFGRVLTHSSPSHELFWILDEPQAL